MDRVDESAVLIIEPPSHIVFCGPLNRPVLSTLCLINPSASKIIFKLKTSAPNSYGVRPNFGIVHPQNFVEIEIVRLAFVYNPTDIKTDRFLIQSLVVPAHIEDINDYWKTADPAFLNSWKLRCVFKMQPLNSQIEAVKGPASIDERMIRASGGEALQQKQIALLRSELDDVLSENENLRRETVKLTQEIERLVSSSNILERPVTATANKTNIKLSCVYFLMVSITFAIVCILIGKFKL